MTPMTTAFAPGAHDLAQGRLLPLEAAADIDVVAEALAASEPWRTLGSSADGLRRYLAGGDPALHRFVVRFEGACAGVLCVRCPWLRGPFLEVIACFEPHRGRGLGSALLSWLESRSALQHANVWACVSTSNRPARAFYARRGFAEIAELDALLRPGLGEILLRKRLAVTSGVSAGAASGASTPAP
jgi:GNAT superfamily N-acetyltransferase